jgi:hypothetical protein
MYHPKPDIDRLHIKRKEGGRGLLQIEVAYKRTENQYCSISEYKICRRPVCKYF